VAPTALNHSLVVVGQIKGAGFGLHFSNNYSFSGLTLCMPLPNFAEVPWHLTRGKFLSNLFMLFLEQVAWDIAVAYNSEFEWVPFGYNIPLAAKEICFELLPQNDVSYFPIG
jgi:hypothetical protein